MRLTDDPGRRFGRGQRSRELEQRKRISVRLGEDAFPNGVIEMPDQHRIENGAGVSRIEPTEQQLRHSLQLLDDLPAREHERHRIGAKTTRDECQRTGRLGIEPLRVVDHAQDGLRPGDLRHEAERREPNQVAVGNASGGEPERDPQRLGLRLRQNADRVRHRPTQLLQPRIRQIDLTLDPLRTNDPEPVRCGDHLLQQRRLADTRLAPHHQRRAPTRRDRREQLTQPLELGISAHEQAQTGSGRLRRRPELRTPCYRCVVRHVSPRSVSQKRSHGRRPSPSPVTRT